MTPVSILNAPDDSLSYLPEDFNKKKFTFSCSDTVKKNIREIQNLSKRQCLGLNFWPKIDKIDAWMITSETRTFMKWGGLGMIASELPEAFNGCFGPEGSRLSVVTPLYVGATKKKKAVFNDGIYTGSEGISVSLNKIADIVVPFMNEKSVMTDFNVGVYVGKYAGVNYVFMENSRFFSINPHRDNPSEQDGCYVLNEFNINEVERFAFFSKSVYKLLEHLAETSEKALFLPNVILANDWHSGALGGLMKYFTVAKKERALLREDVADRLRHIPIVHIAHHLGYQGWDYDNTARLLNSLYEDTAALVLKNAEAVQNNNPRDVNALIISDCYNQASCNFHVADRVVTVSPNYMEEVSKDLGLGLDFRDILKIRKDHKNFFGIINGYEKKLISPLKDKIERLNAYFRGFDFKFFDETTLEAKQDNKEQFIRLVSKLASDADYKAEVIPQIDLYKFEDIAKDIKNISDVPVFCATSRLVEQKGYDIAAAAILNILKERKFKEAPVFVLGGAGSVSYFQKLEKLKDMAAQINKEAARRIFVFRGYKDEFAYAVQLAADFYLMPSLFEPCGLTQMEAMAKGALPVATSTGGLVDTIKDGVDGFRTKVFFAGKYPVYGDEQTAKKIKNNVTAYSQTLQQALTIFNDSPAQIRAMQINAMRNDFSWDVKNGSVYKYYKLLRFGHI